MLREQLARKATDQVRLTQLQVQLSLVEGQLRTLENNVLSLTKGRSPGILKLLQNGINRTRAARREAQEKVARRAEQARKKAEAASRRANQPANPFYGLLNPTVQDVKDLLAQLEPAERRRLNLLLHLKGRPRGTKSALADALGWQRARISHALLPPTSKAYRSISTDTARRIEVALRLKPGALDAQKLDRNQVQLHLALEEFDSVVASIKRRIDQS